MRKNRKAPFAFVTLPSARSSVKPRRSGLTMMVDFGIPLRHAEDIVDLAGPYIDFAKIAVGTSRLYDLAYLRRKLRFYKSSGIRPFIGGQFQEYVFAIHGAAALPGFMAEAKRVGFDVIEISDNCVPLTDRQRFAQIRLAIDSGLTVFGEVGSKDARSDPDGLIRQAEVCLKAGAELVLVEAAELVAKGEPKRDLLRMLRRGIDMAKVLIELPGPWISGVTLSAAEDLKKFLVAEFGPEVNLANVLPQDILETEALRVGLGVVGPKAPRSIPRIPARTRKRPGTG